MIGFVVGVIITLAVGYIGYRVGKTQKTFENKSEAVAKEREERQRIQEEQLEDFNKMMNYDVDVAYDKK